LDLESKKIFIQVFGGIGFDQLVKSEDIHDFSQERFSQLTLKFLTLLSFFS
jgi:hypothetical protein